MQPKVALHVAISSVMLSVILVSPALSAWIRPTPPGPYVKPVDPGLIKRITFSSRKPVVATYVFYWYDSYSGSGLVGKGGKDLLTHHPAYPEGYSWKDPDWWYREMVDMREAGIDVMILVYWGYPGGYADWSFEGLGALVKAQDRMIADGLAPPKVGQFYSCDQLKENHRNYRADLTTVEGKEWFYTGIRDFYSMLPPSMWACIDGKPIVWLYYGNYASKHDDTWPGYVRAEFRKDFGVEPYIVKETSWQGRADALYKWGASIAPSDLGVLGVGPGFDSSALERGKVLRDRDDGRFYSRSWEWALSRPLRDRSKLLVVETWNELFEGTDICSTKEFGREYIDLTRHYADLFHANKTLPAAGLHRHASVSLGDRNVSDGLEQKDVGDALTEPVTIDGVQARRTVANPYGGRYIDFDLDDFMPRGKGVSVELKVTYFDNSKGRFVVEYDSMDFNAPYNGTFKRTPMVQKTGSGQWKTARLILDSPAFAGRLHDLDFRLFDESNDLVVSRVDVTVLR